CIAARLAPTEEGPEAGKGATGALGEPGPARPIGGVRLMARVLWERLKRVFRRGGGDNHA
ncbi:MAG: hypothetical protein ACRDLO_05110, partial [Solirubrobacterales bacterium]